MKNRASNFLLALIVAAATAAAQESAPTPTPDAGAGPQAAQPAAPKVTDASGIVLAEKSRQYLPATQASVDSETRSVSPGIAAALSAGLPKFSPPTPSPTPTPEVKDMADIDKPKNGIIRLPTYVVRDSRPPIFRTRDLYTSDTLLELTMKKHPGLLFGNFMGLNAAAIPGSPAYRMLLDDQRQDGMADLFDTAHAMAQGGDHAEGEYILQQSQSMYMRGSDWDWSGSGPVGGLTGAGK
jgi:hypothetical protein